MTGSDATIQSFRDLKVWQAGMELVAGVYRLTDSFPKEERYGLTSQLRRAAVSIPANIAEGHGRIHTREYVRHLSIARGSLAEVHTLVLIAEQLNFCRIESSATLLGSLDAIGRMLTKLIQRLEQRLSSRQ